MVPSPMEGGERYGATRGLAGAVCPRAAPPAGWGIDTRTDEAAGAEEYVRLRAEWDPEVRVLAPALAYEMDTVALREPVPLEGSGWMRLRHAQCSRLDRAGDVSPIRD